MLSTGLHFAGGIYRAAVSAQGSKGWVLMRRLNSSCRRPMV